MLFLDARVPYYNYVIVTPDGFIHGAMEVDDARDYVMGYYMEKINNLSEDKAIVYEDYGTDPVQTSRDICISLGAYEGDCVIYDLDSVIEKIQQSGIFEEEKVDIIARLMQKNIEMNINDYQIDTIFTEAKVIPVSDT